MRVNNRSCGFRCRPNKKQNGVAAIEFALVAIVYFTLVFGMIELARAMYICNTLQEVTRRAAAAAVNTDFTVPGALDAVRRKAIFRDNPGMLAFADPVTDAHISIDYLSVARTANSMHTELVTSMPSSPARNRLNCAENPNGPSCIRLVRVRVCAPGAAGPNGCGSVPYKTIVSLIPMPFDLPVSTTIMPAETLGQAP
jgi:Flp pilus assembly protein TadG